MIFTLIKFYLPFIVLLVVPVFGLAQTQVENSDQFLGELSGGKYTNGFFGFTMSPPPEMYVLSDHEKAIYKKGGVEMFGKDLKKGRAAYERAASEEVLLFSLTVTKPASTGVSSLNIGAVKQPEDVTPAVICETAAEFFVRNPNYKLASKTKTLKRAGKDFAQVEFIVASGEQTLSLRFYATMRKGYSITFVITHLSKTDLESLEKVLDSLEFS
ncbi:MAG: hypothetical protein ACT4O9_03090 [Blastocatellia bacterium]